MEKIYEKADDQHVRAVVAYARAYGDSKHELYASPDWDTYLDFEDVEAAYEKNMLNIVTYENGHAVALKPVSFDGEEFSTLRAEGGTVYFVHWVVAAKPDAPDDDSGDDSGDGGGK